MPSTVENTIIERLVDRALSLGYAVSVMDGEAFPVKRSTDKKTIIEAMASTDEDKLIFRNAEGGKIGSVWLIYGNGEDLISNHSDNELTQALCDYANFLAA